MSSIDDDLANAKKLLNGLGPEHPKYLDAKALHDRLVENIDTRKIHGDSPELKSERSQIRSSLNEISLKNLKTTMDRIGETSSPSGSSPPPPLRQEPPKTTPRTNKKEGKLLFISHTTQDDNFVARLANDLKTAGQNVWHDGQDIKVSQSIPGEINKALADCEHFIIVLTPESVKSHWVLQELESALAMKKPIVPVLLRDCTRPALIQQLKYADFRKDYQGGLQSLLEILIVIERTEKPASPALEFIFGIIERACYNGDLTPEQGQNQKDHFTRAAMKKQRGEKPMKPANPENTGEMFSYTSQLLMHDLLSLADYHAEWSNLIVSDVYKKESIQLLEKMQKQVLISSALIQQARDLDCSFETQRVLTPLKSLQAILKNIDSHLLSGSLSFEMRNQLESNFFDLTYHLNKFLLLLEDLADNTENQSWVM